MAILSSPGMDITVSDEAQYIAAGSGSVPLVLLATAQDKLTPAGTIASGTIAANAGKLQSFTSQRDLISAMGYPTFRTSGGSPVHGHELNEYGLLAAYSALGVGNSLYAIRADIDLDQLVGTSVRPVGTVDDGLLWFDTGNTSFGIYEWDAETQTYDNNVPTVYNSLTDIDPPAGGVPVYVPKQSVGSIGDYAVVAYDTNNPMFYKNSSNEWVALGTADWQKAWPTVQSTYAVYADNPVAANTAITINTESITITAAGANATGSEVVAAINTVMGASYASGVMAEIDTNGRLILRATEAAMSDGSNADGKVTISGAATLGIPNGTYYAPMMNFGSYTQVPTYATGEDTPAPSGSLWIKTSAIGNGQNWSLKRYSSAASAFGSISANVYSDNATALYELDPLNGGLGIAINSAYIDRSTETGYPATFKIKTRYRTGATSATGSVLTGTPFTIGNTFKLAVTEVGSSTINEYGFTVASTGIDAFVTLILSAGIPDVYIAKNSNNTLTITHRAGGDIYLIDTTVGADNPIADAGFTSNTVRVSVETSGTYDGELLISNWKTATYTASTAEPYVAPDDNTLWYFASAIEADMLICGSDGWKGYRTVSSDARGYDLTNTDIYGPIFSATQPTTQVSGDSLVPGDLWVDTSDMENFPKISRYNGTKWVAIDNTDRITQNGIIFADARWDASVSGADHVGGIVDPITGDLPLVETMLLSNYVDLDCPDYRLYPRGTLLWNTRRNAGNVKKYESSRFTTTNYPDATVGGANTVGYIPAYAATWVNASGNAIDGSPYMGRKAVRNMVVNALKTAIDSNTEVREDQFVFNLIACPGYEELFSNMVALNNDRANTAFVVGDTPLSLKPTTVDLITYDATTAVTSDVYGALYYPSGLSNDLSGNAVVVPPSHMALRVFLKSDNVGYPWLAPAGTRRGLVDNASNIGYVDYNSGAFITTGVGEAIRDTLSQVRINPITKLPGSGLTVFAQKTRSPITQSMDRINVARLVNYIRSRLGSIANNFLFEPNDKATRDQVKQTIDGMFNDLMAKRGIYDYLTVCDESNNTSARIARNELYVDIAIEPMRDVEMIYVPIRLKNPGTIANS